MAHGLQCWRVRGACCPSLLKQLVIWVVVEGIHRHRNVLLQLDVHWNVPGWSECSTEEQTVQTSTRTYPCVVSMHAARSAVLARTGRVLSITS